MSASVPAVTRTFTVPLDHPALPGHFPGNPVVPGVVVLDHVIRMLEAAGVAPTRLRRLRQVKFIEPLLPGEEALVTIDTTDAALTFSVSRMGRTIAKGIFEFCGGSNR